MSARCYRGWLLAILLVALCLRLIAACQWHQANIAEGQLFRLGDSHSYWTLAEQIATGNAYQYGSEDAKIFRTPLFPFFLAPFTSLADSNLAVLAARLGCCFLGCLSVWLVMRFTEELGGRVAALAAGCLAAIHPGAIGMSIAILSEALFMPLMMCHLICWRRSFVREGASRTRNALAVGVWAGLAVLARPSWLLFMPFTLALIPLHLLSRTRIPTIQLQLTIFGLSLLTFCGTMLPWWSRNAAITGRFVPTTLQVGLSLYDGLHPGASGASDEGMAFATRIQGDQRAADKRATEKLSSTFEYRVDLRAKAEALTFARQNPSEVARLAFRKLLKTWSLWPVAADGQFSSTRLALSIGTASILFLACIASYRLLTRPETLAIDWPTLSLLVCWLPCLYFTLLHMLFVGSIRYREPAVFVLCSLAGLALAALVTRDVDSRNALNQPTDDVKDSVADS
jgi:hypothetical protein